MTKVNWNRTDLIDEVAQIETLNSDEKGILIEEFEENRINVKKVTIEKEAAQKLQKKVGSYITLTIPTLFVDDEDGFDQLKQTTVKYLQKLHENIPLTKDSKILVIGLGNKTITPDALGPETIDVLQTLEGNEPLIMYAPGVTGQAGLETKAFVEALVKHVEPNLVLVIDALASKATSRLCKTIQLTDTGIHPGSGVGNERQEIAYETLHVPVTAIGVPTVVDALVLMADAVDILFRSIAQKIADQHKPSSKLAVVNWQTPESYDAKLVEPIFGQWTSWANEERLQLLEEVFLHRERLIVSPKEIDLWNEQFATLISHSITEWTKTFS